MERHTVLIQLKDFWFIACRLWVAHYAELKFVEQTERKHVVKPPLEFYVMARTYSCYGGHPTLSLIPDFLLIDGTASSTVPASNGNSCKLS